MYTTRTRARVVKSYGAEDVFLDKDGEDQDDENDLASSFVGGFTSLFIVGPVPLVYLLPQQAPLLLVLIDSCRGTELGTKPNVVRVSSTTM